MHLQQRILVTGGAGFLGSHLCERLLAQGADVLCVDNFFTGSRKNVEHLLDHKHFELTRHDVTFPLYVEVDEIYNLACPASPIHYQRDPVQTTKTSVHGAINMLGLAKRVKAKILQASTSEVYGDPNVHPQPEEYWGHVNPVGPRSCYDEGKRCAETLFFDYWRQHNLQIKVARIFNTYGPRMHPNDGRVVSNFIIQALLGRELTIYGDGTRCASPAARERPAPAPPGNLARPGIIVLDAPHPVEGRPHSDGRLFRKPSQGRQCAVSFDRRADRPAIAPHPFWLHGFRGKTPRRSLATTPARKFGCCPAYGI